MSKKRSLARKALNKLKKIRYSKMVRSCVAKMFDRAASVRQSQDIPAICQRAFAAKSLFEEITGKLMQSADPDERINLYASLTTLQHLIQKGAQIPGSLDELRSLEEEMHCTMLRPDHKKTESLLMSRQMRAYAARAEKEGQPN